MVGCSDSQDARTNRDILLNGGQVWGVDEEWVKLVPQDLNADNSGGVTGTSWNAIVSHGEGHLDGVHLCLSQHSSYGDQTSVKVHIEEVLQSSRGDGESGVSQVVLEKCQ